ncbi:MAG: glycoside hydrolase 43 family protein, partial [Aeriscardovia aeriphila]|nr:glycoside hydrolase 43 family protein [Aeriscardovia aeriphila]
LFNLSLVARRWQSQNFDAEVNLEFDPTNYMQMAGLTNYYNDFSWSWIFVTFNEKTGKQELQVAVNDRNGYSAPAASVELPEGVHSVRLRTRVRTQTYAYDYSLDGGSTWNTLVEGLDAAQFSDEYIAASYGGFFTGGFVGLACCDVSGFYQEATFTDFLYQER